MATAVFTVAVPALLLSHHLTPLLSGTVWAPHHHLFFGTVASKYINVVFDERSTARAAVLPKMQDGSDEPPPWLAETMRPPLCKYWTAGVPNVLVTRPQGEKLSPDEREYIAKYSAVVTNAEEAVVDMEKALGREIRTSLNLVIGELLMTL